MSECYGPIYVRLSLNYHVHYTIHYHDIRKGNATMVARLDNVSLTTCLLSELPHLAINSKYPIAPWTDHLPYIHVHVLTPIYGDGKLQGNTIPT